MQHNLIYEIFERFARKRPNPKIELNYTSPYTLLVAVVLSAQSTDKGVNIATRPLFDVADTPEKMVLLGLDGLKDYIKSIGLFNNKAKNIIALSNMLIEKYNSEVPSTLDDLIMLPGVGRKSANVILNSIFKQPTIVVDTHVMRVSNRIGLCNTTTPNATEMALLPIIPEEFGLNAHHWLVLHGRYTCKARKPDCSHCVIRDICEYDKKVID